MTLSYLGWLAWWVTVVILAREVAVTGLRFWVIRYGVIAASRGGKLKTLLQVLAISLYMLPGLPAVAACRGDGGRGAWSPWSPAATTWYGPCGCAAGRSRARSARHHDAPRGARRRGTP